MDRHIYLCAWLVCAFFTLPALGDDDLEGLLEMSLEELIEFEVVTPTRTKVQLGSAPGSVTLITRDQIQNSPAQTIPELLRKIPGLNIRWNPMVQTIDVRSFGSNPFTSRVLLLIDGVPYNSWNKGGFPQHPGFDFFNLEYVHHIEVMRGPGSALYGENAFNAVINIVTLSGDDIQVNRVRAQGGEHDMAMASVTRGWNFGKDGSLFFGARQFEGTMPTELWEDYGTGTTQGYDFFTKLRWGGWELTYYRIEDDLDGYIEPFGGGLSGSVFASADKIEQTVDIASVRYTYRSEDDRWGASVHATNARRDGSHCAACHARPQTQAFEDPADHGYQNYLEAHVSFSANERHSLLAGVEYRALDAGDHTEELHGAPTLPPVGTNDHVMDYDKQAIYLQDHIQINERFQIIAGVRYDGATSPDLFDEEFFPRLDAVYEMSDQVTLRAQYGEAARYPSFSEMFQSSWFISAEFPNGPTLVLSEFIPNPDLGPEYITTLTFGAEIMPSPKTRFRFDVYRNVIDDYITIAYPRIRFENHPQEVIVSGFEVDVEWEASDTWSLNANYSYQDNRRRGNGVDSAGSEIEFTYAPRHKANLSIDYEPAQDVSAHLDLHWKGKYRAPAFWYGIVLQEPPSDLDDYTLINLRVDYRLPFAVKGRRPLRLSFIGKNLGNERTPETLIGASAALVGRGFYGQLEYTFAD